MVSPLLRYIILRLIAVVPTLILVSLIIFGLMRLVPGDPATIILGQDATPATLEAVRERLGLNQPLHMQYLNWAGGALLGDLGRSIRANENIAALIEQTLPNTVLLTGAGFFFALALGVPMGVVSSVRRFSKIDTLISALSASGMAMPSFWLGLMLLMVFGLYLGVLPVSGYRPILENPIEGVKSLILPSFTLGVHVLAYVTRMLRTDMLDVLKQDYITMARSKGLPEPVVVYKHAMRNALIPTVTVLGLQLGFSLGGVVIIEEIFLWPGMGRLMYNAVMDRDYTLIQSTILVSSAIFILINLCVDIIYAILNPKIRYAYRGGG